MNTRITLRINNELNELLEKQKEKEKISKNTLIMRACEKLIIELEEKRRKEKK